MTRRLVLVILWTSVVWGADMLPTPDEIFDKYIQVTGGKQAYDQVKTQITKGTLEFTAQGVKGTVTTWKEAPNNYISSLQIGGIGDIEMGVSNGVAWEKSAILGPRIKTGTERAEAIREATLNATLHWKELFTKATVEGVEKVDGEDCYKLVLQPKEGKPMTQYYQKKSGLAVKVMTVVSNQMGEVPVTITVSDYKNFGGVWMPAKTSQKAAGQEFTVTIDSVETNPEIPASRFALPAEIKALAAKAEAAQ